MQLSAGASYSLKKRKGQFYPKNIKTYAGTLIYGQIPSSDRVLPSCYKAAMLHPTT